MQSFNRLSDIDEIPDYSQLPEELFFNISQYYGTRLPGLTQRYILDEIRTLDVDYNTVSGRAEQLGLTNLLRYICTPFNVNQAISVTNLKYGNIPGIRERAYIPDMIGGHSLKLSVIHQFKLYLNLIHH
jgi:hypothetical protein